MIAVSIILSIHLGEVIAVFDNPPTRHTILRIYLQETQQENRLLSCEFVKVRLQASICCYLPKLIRDAFESCKIRILLERIRAKYAQYLLELIIDLCGMKQFGTCYDFSYDEAQ